MTSRDVGSNRHHAYGALRVPRYRDYYTAFREESQVGQGPRRYALRNSANGKLPYRLFSEVSYVLLPHVGDAKM